jgi:hypothetical protein
LAYTLDLNEDKQIVRVTCSGLIRLEELENCRQEASFLLSLRNWRNILADLRRAQPVMSYMDNYSFTQTHREVLPKGTKIALMMHRATKQEIIDATKAATTLAGFSQQLFLSEKKAIGWLTPGTSDSQSSPRNIGSFRQVANASM